jgi:hypothetical protein
LKSLNLEHATLNKRMTSRALTRTFSTRRGKLKEKDWLD